MAPKPSGTYTLRRVDDDIIETTVKGRIDDSVIIGSGLRVLELMKEKPAQFYVIDARDSSTYDPSVARSAKDMATKLFAQGIREIIAISDSGMLRMLGTTIAFALSDAITFVSTREQAIAHARSRRR